VAKDFDPMAKTNHEFYDIINQEDWNFHNVEDEVLLNEAIEELVIDMEEFPAVFEYMLPGPMEGVMIKIMMKRLSDEQQRQFVLFLADMAEFLNNKDEDYG